MTETAVMAASASSEPVSSNTSTTAVTGARITLAKTPATPIATKFGTYAMGMPKRCDTQSPINVPKRVPMTTKGKSVPPGVPALKQTVVKAYFPTKSARTLNSVRVAGSLIFSIRASPPQSKSGALNATKPAIMNGIMRRAYGTHTLILPYAFCKENIPLL